MKHNNAENAGTDAQQSGEVDVTTSAQIKQNPMLCDAISSGTSNYDNNSDVRKAFDNLWNQQN